LRARADAEDFPLGPGPVRVVRLVPIRRSLAVVALVAIASACGDRPVAASAVPVGPAALAIAARAGFDAPPPPPPVVAPVDVFPRLDDEPTGISWSTGDTSHGRVFHARHVTESESLGILPKQAARDLGYGTDELTGLLERAGAAVHEQTGTRMWIGDIGKREGGDIAWSVSHNAGRDADVAFFYLSAAGVPVDAPDLVRLGRDGWSKDKTLRLDVKRTWIAVRAMVEDPAAAVQYLFISTPLKKLLLDHAKTTATSPRTIARATELLREPGSAAPHDDHLHVRVFCSERDAAAGCVDYGAVYAWTKIHSGIREERAITAGKHLASDRAETRARAALRLALLDARDQADAVAQLLDDPAPEVRCAAARALGVVGGRAHAAKLVARYAAEADVRVLLSLLAGAASLGGPEAGALLADVIATDDGPIGELADVAGLEPGAPVPLRDPSDRGHTGDLGVLGGAMAKAAAPALWITPSRSPFADAAAMTALVDREALRRAAIELAGRADASEPAAALVGRLGAATDPAERRRIATSLELVANRSLFDFGREDATPEAIAGAVARWSDVVGKLAKYPRDVWVATGFGASGYAIPSLEHKHAWELVRAVAGPTYTSQAARRWLARMEGASDPGLDWSTGESCKRWMAHFDQHHRKYRIVRTPDAVKRACWGAPR
jgi:murein endopeptidase